MSKHKDKVSQDDLQGEGNYAAAEEYNFATRDFIKAGKVKDAARNAAPKTPKELQEMLQAEEQARSHAKPDLNHMRINDLKYETGNAPKKETGKKSR